jgi:hypothetical protein
LVSLGAAAQVAAQLEALAAAHAEWARRRRRGGGGRRRAHSDVGTSDFRNRNSSGDSVVAAAAAARALAEWAASLEPAALAALAFADVAPGAALLARLPLLLKHFTTQALAPPPPQVLFEGQAVSVYS